MNAIRIVGNLTRDPDVKVTKNGGCMARFTIASNRTFIDGNGEKKEFADFINCLAWGEVAESVGNYLQKGKRVIADGRYQTRQYEDEHGNKKYSTEIIISTIGLVLPMPKRNQNATQGQGGQQSYPNTQQQGSGDFSGFGESYDDPSYSKCPF